jgi:hypothetical protein
MVEKQDVIKVIESIQRDSKTDTNVDFVAWFDPVLGAEMSMECLIEFANRIIKEHTHG